MHHYSTAAVEPEAAVASPRNMTAREIAPHLTVSRRTVLNWFSSGVIPAEIAVGRVIRFNLEDVRAALKSQAE